jgi:glutamate-1-semialdehyde aminotransferase
MGKLKEKLLNNLSEDELNEKTMGDISAFEYVEYMEKYKSQEEFPQPTEEDMAEMEAIIKEYYESDEFQKEIQEINEMMSLKYSDSDVLNALQSVIKDIEVVNKVMSELNEIHNFKMGYMD